MGREIRKVAANWEHPKNNNGNYIPLLGYSFSEQLKEYIEGERQWKNGFKDDYNGGWIPKEGDELEMSFKKWHGSKPVKEHYMPEWSDEEKTHIQLYESTSEGTPVSPVFKADEFEKLCEYAAINCLTFADFKSSKEGWMNMLKEGIVGHQEGNVLFI